MAEEEKKIKRASDRRRERSARHEAKIKEYERQMTPKTLELHKQYFRKPTANDLYKARLRKEKDERIEKENRERENKAARTRGGGGGGLSFRNILEGMLPGKRKMAKGGVVGGAKKKTTKKFRGDGIARKGKTKGRFV